MNEFVSLYLFTSKSLSLLIFSGEKMSNFGSFLNWLRKSAKSEMFVLVLIFPQFFFAIVKIDNFSNNSKMSATLLLIQADPRYPESRTYQFYESVTECVEGVCKIYEEYLKAQYPHRSSITYDLHELYEYLDQFYELNCLVFQRETGTYAPFTKDWIKERITAYFVKQMKWSSSTFYVFEFKLKILFFFFSFIKRSRSLPPEEFAYLTAKLKELDLVQRTDSLGSGRWVEYHEKSHMHLKSEQEICLCKNVPSRYKKWHLPFGWHTTFQDSFVMSRMLGSSKKKPPWKMTSSCRYPQKLLGYKTCYYVIITSHSVLYPIKMQNLKHENLSFIVTLEVWQRPKVSNFEEVFKHEKKCHFQQKSKGAKRYHQNFMRWIWPIQKVGLAWMQEKDAWTKKQRPEKAFGTEDTPRVSQGNK